MLMWRRQSLPFRARETRQPEHLRRQSPAPDALQENSDAGVGFTCVSVPVGVPRFELGTSRTRTVRSTGLSHTPLAHGLYPRPVALASPSPRHKSWVSGPYGFSQIACVKT